MVKSVNQAESAQPSELSPLPCHSKPRHTSKLFSVIALPCKHPYCYDCAASRVINGNESHCLICPAKVESILVVRGQSESVVDPARLARYKCTLCKTDSGKFLWEKDAQELHLTEQHVPCLLCSEYLADQAELDLHRKLVHFACTECPFDEQRAHLSLAKLENHCKTRHPDVKIDPDDYFEMVGSCCAAAAAKNGRVVSQVVATQPTGPIVTFFRFLASFF